MALQHMPTPTVEVGFGNSWFGGDGGVSGNYAFTSIPTASYVRNIQTTSGRHDSMADPAAAQMTVELQNTNDAFNEDNPASPFYFSGVGLLPFKGVRLRATWGAASWLLWFGLVLDWTCDYTPDAERRARMRAVDPTITLVNRPISTTRGAESSSARVPAILTRAAWVFGLTADTYPADTLQAVTLTNDMAWNHLSAIAQSTRAVFVYQPGPAGAAAARGTLTYLNAASRASSALAVTFTPQETPPLGAPTYYVPYHRVSPLDSGEAFIINNFTATNCGGTPYVAFSPDSDAQYSRHNRSQSGMLQQDAADVQAFATTMIARYANHIRAPRWVEVDLGKIHPSIRSGTDGVFQRLLDPAAAMRIGAQANVIVNGQTFAMSVEGIDHTISAANTWVARYWLSPLAYYTT